MPGQRGGGSAASGRKKSACQRNRKNVPTSAILSHSPGEELDKKRNGQNQARPDCCFKSDQQRPKDGGRSELRGRSEEKTGVLLARLVSTAEGNLQEVGVDCTSRMLTRALRRPGEGLEGLLV